MNTQKNLLVLFDVPPPYGGVRVLANISYMMLKQKSDFIVQSCPFKSYKGSLINNLIEFNGKIKKSEIIIFQIGNIFTLLNKRTLIYLCIAVLSAKPLVFRGFSGGLANRYKSLNSLKKLLLIRLLSLFNLITFETIDDIEHFSSLIGLSGLNLRWFPNTREWSSIKLSSREKALKFCFIGKICKEKGVDLIVNIASDLPENVTVELFGPLDQEFMKADLKLNDCLGVNLHYRGTIEPENVTNVLKDFDVLLLPTTWDTEGHPGVILEALSVGLPVIATRWNGIPELIDDTCGILIEPNSKESLIKAIRNIHNDCKMWQKMRVGATKRSEKFDAKIWHDVLNNWLYQLVKN